MLDTARQIWRWSGWLLSFALAAAARELLANSKTMTEVAGAIVSSAAWGVTTLAVGMFVMWCVFVGWRMLPAQRFRAKAELIENAMIALESDHGGDGEARREVTASTKSLLHQAIHALDRLKVPHPPFAYGVNRWLVFLSRLSAASRVGDLERAKTIWPEMKQETERASADDRERNQR